MMQPKEPGPRGSHHFFDGPAARAVFLDRDGVINESILRDGRPHAPTTFTDFKLLPGTAEALARLKAAGFLLIVVTNQPDLSQGKLKPEELQKMHAHLRSNLPIDDIRVCAHTDEDACNCRKPKPGMLIEAASERSICLSESFMVGDRWRDIEAGAAAGCRTILIGDGYGEREIVPDRVFGTLPEAVSFILSQA